MTRIPVLWLCVLAGACSIEERGAPGTDPDAKLELSLETDSLEVTLAAPPVARNGEEVPITITVRNATARTLDLALLGREIAFDISIAHNDSTIWRRLAGQTIPSILQLKTLQPNEAFELMHVWRADVPEGNYGITARIPTDAQPLVPDPVAITIR